MGGADLGTDSVPLFQLSLLSATGMRGLASPLKEVLVGEWGVGASESWEPGR